MKHFYLCLLPGALFLAAACSGQSDDAPAGTTARDLSVTEFRERLAGGSGLLLDVRTTSEFEAGHIEGAANLDYHGEDFRGKLSGLDKAVPVFVYCQSGGRSGRAMDMMRDMGFAEVYNLEGGYGAWVEAAR